jgi:hypothetical protein
MKSIPPQHAALPVLTERLPADLAPFDSVPDSCGSQTTVAPLTAEPDAQPHAAMPAVTLAPAQTVDVERLWAQIAPELQQRLSQAVRVELQAVAPQLAQQLWQAFEQSVHDALALSIRPR